MSEVRTIKLSRGLEARVSAEDYDALSKHRWFALVIPAKNGTTRVYAVRHAGGADGKTRTIYMHREIIADAERSIVRHRDGDGLNNQRDNLHAVQRNRRKDKLFVTSTPASE